MDINDLSGLKQTFDGILAQAVMLHIPKTEIRSVIKNIIDKLNQNGYLYIAVKEKKPDGMEEEVVVEEDYGYKYERFFSYFTLPELRNYLTDLDMKICYETIASSGKTNWIQIISQKA